MVHRCLLDQQEARPLWPTHDEIEQFSLVIANREPLVDNAFGFVDGTKFYIDNPLDTEKQNAYYNGWLHKTAVSCVFLWTPDGKPNAAYLAVYSYTGFRKD